MNFRFVLFYLSSKETFTGDVLSDDVFSSMDGDNMPENSDVSFEVVDELYESDLKEANNVPGKNDISLEHNHNNTLSQSNSNIIPSWTITGKIDFMSYLLFKLTQHTIFKWY